MINNVSIKIAADTSSAIQQIEAILLNIENIKVAIKELEESLSNPEIKTDK